MLHILVHPFEIHSSFPKQYTGRGGLPHQEYTGVCHELGSYSQEKIPKRVCQFFTKIPERKIPERKKFQIESVILMAQMTNLNWLITLTYFGLKIHKVRKIFGKWKLFLPKIALKAVFWRPPLGTKFRKGSYFFVKNSRMGRCRDHKVAHPRAKISWVPPRDSILLCHFQCLWVANITSNFAICQGKTGRYVDWNWGRGASPEPTETIFNVKTPGENMYFSPFLSSAYRSPKMAFSENTEKT